MTDVSTPVPEIDPATLAAWLEEGTAVVIDVREEEEWEDMRLPAAALRPMSTFDPAELPARSGRRLVVLCRSGRRSLAVARRLLREGETEVYNLAGGILAWEALGLPVQMGQPQERAA